MNTQPIDIVIPWVNSSDKYWQNTFEYWKHIETGNTDKCRYRDWGFIKYLLRSIEQNCVWCRYVFLILACPSQIPAWLNSQHPKLKIIYHKDYIPAEFLPTFNSSVIELFVSNIAELSDNFILCNDDTIFSNKMTEDFYFKDDLPVMADCRKPAITAQSQWEQIVINSKNVANKILNISSNYVYYNEHLQSCFSKPLQQFVLYKTDLSFMLKSKFRKHTDVSQILFLQIQGHSKHKIFVKPNTRGMYYGINNTKFNINFNYPLICTNEGEHSAEIVIQDCLRQLSSHFKKSSFEL